MTIPSRDGTIINVSALREDPTTSPGFFDDHDGNVVRCRNWRANRDLCGPECGILYPSDLEVKDIPWTRWVHSHGWSTIENGRIAEGEFHHHAIPFCSMACVVDWFHREHPDVFTFVEQRWEKEP